MSEQPHPTPLGATDSATASIHSRVGGDRESALLLIGTMVLHKPPEDTLHATDDRFETINDLTHIGGRELAREDVSPTQVHTVGGSGHEFPPSFPPPTLTVRINCRRAGKVSCGN